MDFKTFVKNNKDKILKLSKQSTPYDSNGVPMIASNDAWAKEDIWDKHYKELARGCRIK